MARRTWFWIAPLLAAGLFVAGVMVWKQRRKPVVITGAVTVQDADPRKQLPISDVEVSVRGSIEPAAKSDSSGFFRLTMPKGLRRGQPIRLTFRHPNYRPLDLQEFAGDKLYIVHMAPLSNNTAAVPNKPLVAIANVRIRYSIMSMRTINVGSAVRTFEVQSVGNIPCKSQPPCSPDGRWKASIASTSLDAGPGNEFQKARVSCIAGPCPFTQIESDGADRPNQKITVTARSWSEPTTFLVEAEVIHTMQSPIEHRSYPVVFGSALSFTLPTDSEGVSMEADVAGETIIFPLGPDLFLSWASCNGTVNPDHTSVYRCELKPGYRFQ